MMLLSFIPLLYLTASGGVCYIEAASKVEAGRQDSVEGQQESLGFNLMLIVTRGGDKQEIVDAGLEAKRELWQRWIGLVQEANIIDSIVARYNGFLPWTWGVQNPDVAAPPPTGPNAATTEKSRKDRILDKAQLLSQDGDGLIKTAAVAEQLRADGDKTDARNLMTSIGNTLSRNGWVRIRDGEYRREIA